jgi:hypothetical protein
VADGVDGADLLAIERGIPAVALHQFVGGAELQDAPIFQVQDQVGASSQIEIV